MRSFVPSLVIVALGRVLHVIAIEEVLKTGIKTFYVNERPNLEVDGFPVIDEVYTLRGLEEFVNQSYAANPVGGGVVGIFNAQVDDVSEFLVQKDMGKSKEDSSDLSAALLTYVQVAYELRNRGFRFGLSTSEELVERLGDKAYTIYVYKPPKYLSEHFGEQAVDHYYEIKPALEGLREFVLEHSMPLVGRVMEDNEMQYVLQDLPVFLLFLDGQDLLNHKLLSFYRVVAAKYTAVARFAVVDKMEAHMVLRYYRTDLLGFDEEDVLEDNFKAFACFSSKSKKAYRLGAADFSTRSIESFIRRIVYGDKDSAFAYEVSSKLDTKEDL